MIENCARGNNPTNINHITDDTLLKSCISVRSRISFPRGRTSWIELKCNFFRSVNRGMQVKELVEVETESKWAINYKRLFTITGTCLRYGFTIE